MAKARSFGQLPKNARDRAARIAKRDYGLTRRQVRERYNRGTYNPFARGDPLLRIPRELRRYAERTNEGIEVNWEEAAIGRMSAFFKDYYGYSADTVAYNVSQASDDVLRYMATASEDEIRDMASIQPDVNGHNPDFMDIKWPVKDEDIGWTDAKGKWHNNFWYHG